MDVSDLLVEWGYPELVEQFRVQQFDFDSLLELDSSSLSEYVPMHGPRLKLLKKIRELKESLQATPLEVVVVESEAAFTADYVANDTPLPSLIVAGCSSSPELAQIPEQSTKRRYEDLVLEETLVASTLEALDIKAVLEGDALTKHILTQLDANVLPKGDWRNRIVDVLVSQALLKISRNLTLDQLKGVAEKLANVLPGERPCTYYLGADSTRRLVTGKLVDKYHNLKSKLRDPTNKRQRSSASTSSSADAPPTVQTYALEERQQSLAWLRFNRTPWPEVQRHWGVVYQDRLKLLHPRPVSKKDNKIAKYYEEFPVLTDKAGWQLLVADFEKIYPDKTGRLFATWPAIQQSLLSTGVDCVKDSFSNSVISQLQNSSHVTESAEIILHLMLLPSIFKTNTSVQYPVDPSKPEGPKKNWKPTLAESRDGFILHVQDPNDVKRQLETRLKKMQMLGLKCQPLIVICGPSLLQFTHCQVSINGILYHVPGPLQAVDLAFKSFQVLNVWYPIECEQAWLFIQREIYKITTRFDNQTSGYLTALGTFKKYLK